jgi:HSP20 family protein
MPMIRRKDEPLFGQPLMLRDEMNKLFDNFFTGAVAPVRESEWRTTFFPAIDVHETTNEVIVTAELPGIKPEEVEINLTGNILTLKGEKKDEVDEKGKNWHRIERSYGSFQRAFQLPETVDPEKAKATYDKGVLKINIAKTESSRPRTIKVDVK